MRTLARTTPRKPSPWRPTLTFRGPPWPLSIPAGKKNITTKQNKQAKNPKQNQKKNTTTTKLVFIWRHIQGVGQLLIMLGI
jgi:hypothetical protein